VLLPSLFMCRRSLTTLVSCIVLISANSFSLVSNRRLLIHHQSSLSLKNILPNIPRVDYGLCCGVPNHAKLPSSDDTPQQINKPISEGIIMRYLILVLVLIIHGLHNYYLAFQPSLVLFGMESQDTEGKNNTNTRTQPSDDKGIANDGLRTSNRTTNTCPFHHHLWLYWQCRQRRGVSRATRGNESESSLQFFQCGLSNNKICYITVDEY
jgi:hypothetical protein